MPEASVDGDAGGGADAGGGEPGSPDAGMEGLADARSDELAGSSDGLAPVLHPATDDGQDHSGDKAAELRRSGHLGIAG